MRVSVFLAPIEYLRTEELARFRGYSGAVAQFCRSVLLRELAFADERLDRGIPDVTPLRAHARELQAAGKAPGINPLQTGANTRAKSSPRGPQ